MLKHVRMAGACVAVVTATASATAGTIYKCSEGGRISYHDRPCGHTAVALDVKPAAPAPETLQRLARERALLQELEGARADQEKREQQQAQAHARIQRAAASQRQRCDKLRLQHKWLDEDVARAGRDDGERARIKARRQSEVLAVECPD